MPETGETQGLVLSISRASAEDGPGIRTVVFMKGCPLGCAWCHSPQSQGGLTPVLSFYGSRCIGCGGCRDVCPDGALVFSEGERFFYRERCKACGRCAAVCPSRALELTGTWLGVSDIIATVRCDRAYYDSSGGGVTFSGGEPLMQPDFLTACLHACREDGIHTAVETSGFAPWSVIEKVVPYVDLFLYDLKHMDSEKHRELTGVPNELILENLRCIGKKGGKIWVRLPLIPDINDDKDELTAVATFIRDIPGIKKVSLLPYNVAAGARYQQIGRTYALEGLSAQPRERLRTLCEVFTRLGLVAEAGR